MRNNPLFSPSWVGAYLVCLFLAFLYLSEPLIKQRTFSFNSSAQNGTQQTVLPVDEILTIISPGNLEEAKQKKQESLRGLLEKARNSDGKLLVNFWATWCEPCLEEIPTLGALSDQLKNQSNKSLPLLITISVDETPEPVLLFEKKLGHPFPFVVLHDPDGAFSRKLGITKFPETFLIDAKGNTLQKWIGPQDWLSLEVLQLLKNHARS